MSNGDTDGLDKARRGARRYRPRGLMSLIFRKSEKREENIEKASFVGYGCVVGV